MSEEPARGEGSSPARAGEAASLPIAVDEQIQYLRKASVIVQNFINGLGARKSGLEDHDKIPEIYYQGPQNEFEKAFPDYKLSYMTRSGLKACWDCPGTEISEGICANQSCAR
jgi:hypothetical protein